MPNDDLSVNFSFFNFDEDYGKNRRGSGGFATMDKLDDIPMWSDDGKNTQFINMPAKNSTFYNFELDDMEDIEMDAVKGTKGV